MSKQWETWDEEKIKTFQETFLTWYHKEKRNLPWRATNDPYAIWISEIMLQQTRVETVIGYFYRFMEQFPTIQDLAAAEEQKLLKVWEGLGYYSRARNLKAAAQQIVAEFDGEMPRSIEEIRSLKGIGPYTAGAIGSIAFGLPEPAIDGNVMRVVSRLFCIEADIAKASSRRPFDEAMRTIISPDEPGEFNQALMDLGSRICTPTTPKCEECPISQYCLAYAENRQTDFPVKSKKAKPKDVYYIAGAIEDQGSFLLVQRPETGLLASMWHFPLVEVTKEQYEALQRTWAKEEQLQLDLIAEDDALEIFPDLPVVWQKRHFGEITHIFSHLKWHVLLFYGRKRGELTLQDSEWAAKESFQNYVFPKPQQKLVDQLKKYQKLDKDF
ncbi:A/G-specific adenine glycosylase [Enterococcus sp. DIV1279b]|uniref:A/G-specific adenine glycosylase n=1 Tax=Enterococcus TaxID=1350 RepID=UPI00032DC118|nr:A/G-specific adenine glycosylase [Enterococcus casseliflavus]EOH84482.1 A/G-specific adenine glycosylase [Enterococcus casseliflavus ATCC 49996]EOU10850.1 A/G-specific adenine glycosylase [Enterococcus casseliflavus ATCC 49996]MBE9879511.1 A/G-specific adenine glycosylase [Enterococcus casseliflavus]QQB84702.1 A/G-specific adenine glycosylase [Enterococcus casseliflavus]QQU15764.1 A/G-specific adenine glycosylase [Enterococcus casseliflavus]